MQSNPIQCYCIKLRRGAQQLTEFYDRSFAPFGISTNQFFLLARIKALKSCSIAMLAKDAGQDRSTLARTLKPLFSSKLIEDTSPGKRNRSICISKQGLHIFKQAMPVWEKTQGLVESLVGKSNLALLSGSLEMIETLFMNIEKGAPKHEYDK